MSEVIFGKDVRSFTSEGRILRHLERLKDWTPGQFSASHYNTGQENYISTYYSFRIELFHEGEGLAQVSHQLGSRLRRAGYDALIYNGVEVTVPERSCCQIHQTERDSVCSMRGGSVKLLGWTVGSTLRNIA